MQSAIAIPDPADGIRCPVEVSRFRFESAVSVVFALNSIFRRGRTHDSSFKLSGAAPGNDETKQPLSPETVTYVRASHGTSRHQRIDARSPLILRVSIQGDMHKLLAGVGDRGETKAPILRVAEFERLFALLLSPRARQFHDPSRAPPTQRPMRVVIVPPGALRLWPFG